MTETVRLRSLREQWRRIRAATRQARLRSPRLVALVLAVFVAVTVVSVAVPLWYLRSLRSDLPTKAAIARMGEMDQATAVYDRHDQLAFTIFKEQRIETPLPSVSPHLVHAILAIEDQRFYEHPGFDTIRIFSAAWANVRNRRAAQGGSTITQQLARQSFLTPDKTLRRKLQELMLAARIEAEYTKPQILELYLNKVYFGDGLYGVEAASRGYFGKHASELSVSDAAVLAGLVKAPSTYAPTVSMSRAVARRNVVLQAMLSEKAIDQPTWKAARAESIVLKDALRSDEPHGQYFKEQMRQELVQRFGWQSVYQEGLRVYSTIDMPMQLAAEEATADALKALDKRRQAVAARQAAAKKTAPIDDPIPLQAAVVALEPGTGHVLAMVGGRDFLESRFNRAVQAHRQPGSAFKPFVYAAALEAGYTPASVIDHLSDSIATVQGAWTPEDEHSSAESMSLRTGLRTSSNRAAVRLLQQVGIPRTVAYAKTMGVGDVPSVPSLALGSGEVTLESMTAAYAAFANRGIVPNPILIRRVEDRAGHVLYEAPTEPRGRAISESTAFLMSTMLADVINAGTAANARGLGFTLPAAGKTGTTNDFKDAWFIGYTPKLVAGVWVGFDEPRTILPNGFAGDVAVPLWTRFMKAATRDDKPEWFTAPAGVTTASVCRLSGKLASEGCNHAEVMNDKGDVERRSLVYTEYFAKGTTPSEVCDLHPNRGLMDKLASILSGSSAPAPSPPHVSDAGLPPTAPAAVAAATSSPTDQAAAPPAPEPPKKKRGFFARIFGRRGSDDKGDRSEEKTEREDKNDKSEREEKPDRNAP
ncbi:MAG: PBP1A family penicillin-binding protein [Acidobacteriota bacterium]